MKRLKVANGGGLYKAKRILKTDDRIVGYDEVGDIAFDFNGIHNFDNFQLLDGAAWDVNEEAEKDALKERIEILEGALLEMIIRMEKEV